MKIGAPETKCADAGPPGHVRFAAEPGACFGIDVKRRIFNVKFGIWPGDIDGGGQNLVMQRQGGLNHPGRSGCALGMGDLRLNRTQGDILAVGVVFQKYFTQSLEFGRVAGGGPGAVSLDQADSGGIITGFLVSAAQCNGLAGSAWGVNAFIAPIAG